MDSQLARYNGNKIISHGGEVWQEKRRAQETSWALLWFRQLGMVVPLTNKEDMSRKGRTGLSRCREWVEKSGKWDLS
jgi:hypothetical protein